MRRGSLWCFMSTKKGIEEEPESDAKMLRAKSYNCGGFLFEGKQGEFWFAEENFSVYLIKQHLLNEFVQVHEWTTTGCSGFLCLLLQLHDLLSHFVSFLSRHEVIDQLLHLFSLHIGINFNPNFPFFADISAVCWLICKEWLTQHWYSWYTQTLMIHTHTHIPNYNNKA